ncbi:Peptidyl-prolyl cis-trans isomerase-like 3 [Smittium mucronatum]|uniref:Peptidyl-prolyl cis-trans isomerase n=1 Tax=Smittium mucronatum TaxID=133383 RepID=A0A1R0H247_9FUNG|nr:Peptidyl-prolyl cis-trans isomerase-like 3 [Smittium mucronatum]
MASLDFSVTFHTDLGDLKIEVYCEDVPKTAYNFLALCASGYYDTCLFHRNIKGFIVQTGDKSGTGTGGESIWGDEYPDEIRTSLKHVARGVVSMANSGPDTNKSQFFITYGAQPSLDSKYTVFGRVIDGADSTLALIEDAAVDGNYRPLKDIRINSVTIHANPLA